MLLDVSGVVICAQSFTWIPLQKTDNNIFAFLGDVFGRGQLLMLDVFEKSLFVEAVIWWHAL